MSHVDLTNLRTITDGDKDIEEALFEEFFNTFDAGITTMRASMEESTAERWRQEAHALKGVSLNLGADSLGSLCMDCQDQHLADVTDKTALLQKVEAEYVLVRSHLIAIIHNTA